MVTFYYLSGSHGTETEQAARPGCSLTLNRQRDSGQEQPALTIECQPILRLYRLRLRVDTRCRLPCFTVNETLTVPGTINAPSLTCFLTRNCQEEAVLAFL